MNSLSLVMLAGNPQQGGGGGMVVVVVVLVVVLVVVGVQLATQTGGVRAETYTSTRRSCWQFVLFSLWTHSWAVARAPFSPRPFGSKAMLPTVFVWFLMRSFSSTVLTVLARSRLICLPCGVVLLVSRGEHQVPVLLSGLGPLRRFCHVDSVQRISACPSNATVISVLPSLTSAAKFLAISDILFDLIRSSSPHSAVKNLAVVANGDVSML